MWPIPRFLSVMLPFNGDVSRVRRWAIGLRWSAVDEKVCHIVRVKELGFRSLGCGCVFFTFCQNDILHIESGGFTVHYIGGGINNRFSETLVLSKWKKPGTDRRMVSVCSRFLRYVFGVSYCVFLVPVTF